MDINKAKESINSDNRIYEIFCIYNVIYLKVDFVRKITDKNMIICNLNPSQGIKIGALNQFNRSYRNANIRGNHLNIFRCFSLHSDLEKNTKLFMKRFKKVTGFEIESEEYYAIFTNKP